MYFGPEYERGFFVMVIMAAVGAVSSVVGIILLAIWIWNHVSITW